MRLTKEHKGRKVLFPNAAYPYTIKEIDGEWIWVMDKNGDHESWRNTDDYTLVEEPKKPSERIKKIIGLNTLGSYCTYQINAIIDYLDEEFEKKP